MEKQKVLVNSPSGKNVMGEFRREIKRFKWQNPFK